jgi:succinyl-diaminopimelate desuccinylase
MNVVSLCSDLVSIRSENPPGDVSDVIEYIRGFTEAIGIPTRITGSRDGRLNLVSARTKNPLLLCGHVDVVPALKDGWSVDPYSGEVRDGFVWGRGSTDMKGGCASILWACKSIVDSGLDLPCDLAFVCDEETSGTFGIRHLLECGLLSPCDCLIAEPTPALHPNIGQKGLMRINFLFKGEPGHSSLYPLKGVSAIMEAYSLLEHLQQIHSRDYDPGGELSSIIEGSSRVLEEEVGLSDGYRVLRRVMFNPGRIEGGEKANIVAQSCTLELDIRLPWGCSIPALIDELRACAPGVQTSSVDSSEPSFTSPTERVVERTLQEIARVHGSSGPPIVSWAASDARYLRKAGFSVVEYGPGDISLLHSIDERVPIKSLECACDVFEGLIRSYLIE